MKKKIFIKKCLLEPKSFIKEIMVQLFNKKIQLV